MGKTLRAKSKNCEKIKHYKTNKTFLLFALYDLEDKTHYKNKSLSRYIDKLQGNIKIKRFGRW